MQAKVDLYIALSNAIVKFEAEDVKRLSQKALEMGYDPVETILEGLSAGMNKVGELYQKHEYFVPEILMCADALQSGLDILKPKIAKGQIVKKGKVVIGTVQGDIHDIGKDIVKLMLEVGGFEVFDLGKDVPHQKFVDEMTIVGADIVAMSAMMTTTMMGMKKVIQMVRAKNPNVAIMIGGAPVSKKVVNMFGADGYAETAATVAEEATRTLEHFKKVRAL